MPDEVRVTAETVAAAAEALVADGQRPSTRLVRERLGGGSLTTILDHLRAWKSRGTAPSEAAGEAAAGEEKPALPKSGTLATLDSLPEVGPVMDALSRAVLAAVSRVQADAAKAADARITSLQTAHAEELAARDRKAVDDLAAVRQELADANAELAEALPAVEAAEKLDGQLKEAAAARDTAQSRVRELEGEVARLKADLATAKKAAETAEGRAAEWKTQLDAVRGDAKTAAEQATAAAEKAKAEMAAATETIAGLKTEIAVAAARAEAEGKRAERAEADVERLRRERAEAESAAREAVAQAAKAAAEAEAARADRDRLQQEAAIHRPVRSGKTSAPAAE